MRIGSMEIRNGQIWKSPSGQKAIVQWIVGDEFGLLSVPEKGICGGTVMIFITDVSGLWRYKIEDMPERLKNWTLLKDHSVELCIKYGVVNVLEKS